jgi:hypothetical protein
MLKEGGQLQATNFDLERGSLQGVQKGNEQDIGPDIEKSLASHCETIPYVS